MTDRVLCYINAFDRGPLPIYQQQARMLVASLLHTGFAGDIKLIHNGAEPVFRHHHEQVEEIGVNTPETNAECSTAKYRSRSLFSVDNYDWVMFLDVDCIAATPLDDWFNGPEIIRYATEPRMPIQLSQFSGYLSEDEMVNLKQGGFNSGSFIIKAEYYQEVLTEWERIDNLPILRERQCCDQPAWNRLLLDTPYSKKHITGPDVHFYYDHPNFMDMLGTPFMHFCGCDNPERILAMQAKFITHFHTDAHGSLLRVLAR
ncbi:MAG: hypothetical protein V4584_00175 [Verrucomicrobiota bacterium]